MEVIAQIRKAPRPAASAHAVGSKALPLSQHIVPVVQTKLRVNTPGDKFEREADAMSEHAMRFTDRAEEHHNGAPPASFNSPFDKSGGPSTVTGPAIGRKETAAQGGALLPALLTPVSHTDIPEEAQTERLRFPRGEKESPHSAGGQEHLENTLKSTKGGGQPLPLHIGRMMQGAFGKDFREVRVHTDGRAAEMNGAFESHAFTHGKDIYFNSGMYDPHSTAGRKLIAHELTHVAQQGAAAAQAPVQRRSAKQIIAADADYQGQIKKVKSTATQAKRHDTAAAKVKSAQSAAKPPLNEKASKAKDRKVAEMAQQEPGTFNEEKFKAALKAKIMALHLNTLKEAEDFKKNNGASAVKGDMAGQVSAETNTAASAIDNKTREEPAASKEAGKEVGPPVAASPVTPTPALDPAKASPKPVTEADISLQQGSRDLDKKMSDAKVTDTQLAKSNEPTFKNALTQKNIAQKDAVQAPQQFRKAEAAALSQSKIVSATTSKTHLSALASGQKQRHAAVLLKQEEAKVKDEQARQKVATDIDQKFSLTKTDVEGILSKLDKDVSALFDNGIATATQRFEDFVDYEVTQFKINRYLVQVGGSVLWAYDLLKGPPDEINDIYRRGKDKYIQAMDIVISKAATLVVSQLNAAKKRIATGKQEIKTYVEALPKELQSVGAEAVKKVQAQFTELASMVDNKQNDLVDSLAAKYQAGLENIDKKIADMKEANKGLIDMAKEAINDVINAIIEFKNLLMNTLAKAKSAIDLIIEDPIGFLGNLVAGVKQGIQGFVARIGQYLKAGLMGWLFGTLAKAGVELPKTFDAKGILSLVLQILGLTYANIRSRAVKIVGEKVVAGMEKAAEIFLIIKNEGIGGLWKFIKEKAEEIKNTVIDSIKEFVIEKIVVAGITWLISLLNPASAFIKACKMIYDVIVFFINKGKQIMDLVNAVLDSVISIAKGAIGVAASAVENALGKAVPVALGFLASLLGLDGISEKIKVIIAKIQAPVNKVIDWVINQAVSLVKAAGKLLGIGGKDPEKDKADKEERLAKGMAAGKKAVAKFEGKTVGKVVLGPLLAGIRIMYRMTSLEVVKSGDHAELVGVINPKSVEPLRFRIMEGEPELPQGLKLGMRITYEQGTHGETKNKNVYTIHSINKDTLFVYLVSADGYVKKPVKLEDFEQQWKDKAFTKYTESSADVPKMDPLSIVFHSGGYDFAEFQRQVILQERGINAMAVVHWHSHKTTFDQLKQRNPKSKYAQSRARNDEYQRKIDIETIRLKDEYFKKNGKQAAGNDLAGINAKAVQIAEDMKANTAALHGPDQVSGGHYKGITGLGELEINSSMGSQWAKVAEAEIDDRARTLFKHADKFIDQIKSLDQSDKEKAMMNVRLSVVETEPK